MSLLRRCYAGPVWAPKTVSVVSGDGVLPSVESRGASLNGSTYPSGSLPDPAQLPAANRTGTPVKGSCQCSVHPPCRIARLLTAYSRRSNIVLCSPASLTNCSIAAGLDHLVDTAGVLFLVCTRTSDVSTQPRRRPRAKTGPADAQLGQLDRRHRGARRSRA